MVRKADSEESCHLDDARGNALSTILYDPLDGLYLIARHLTRLRDAHVWACKRALRTGDGEHVRPLDDGQVLQELWRAVDSNGRQFKQRIRVVVDFYGRASATSTLLSTSAQVEPVTMCLDTRPTFCDTPHKTTARSIYDAAKERVGARLQSSASGEQPSDVLMWNEYGEVTETSIANFAIESRSYASLDNQPRYVTPRLSSGMIRGVMREELLSRGDLVEGEIFIEEVIEAAQAGRGMIAFNALRKVYPVRLVPLVHCLCPSLHRPASAPFLGPGVIIDCWDSFTNNLLALLNVSNIPADAFEASLAENVAVIRLHHFDWATFRDLILPFVDWIIVSPGPGRPDNQEDFGFCAHLFRSAEVPILGVCLGHQGLADAYGRCILQSDEIMHGQPVQVFSNDQGLFAGVPSAEMVRYNSLSVSLKDLPQDIEVMAWSRSKASRRMEIMGLQHRVKPHFGVQFHLESTCSDHGKAMQLMRNFACVVERHRLQSGRASSALPEVCKKASYIDFGRIRKRVDAQSRPRSPALTFVARPIDLFMGPQDVFDCLVSLGDRNESTGEFWLDSARPTPGDPYSNFTYMGLAGTSLWYAKGGVHLTSGKHNVQCRLAAPQTFWGWLDDVQEDLYDRTLGTEGYADLGDFKCGLVGYFGYELARESMSGYRPACGSNAEAVTPEAQFLLADRMLVYDHATRRWHVMGLIQIRDARPTILEETLGCRIGCNVVDFNKWANTLSACCRQYIQDDARQGSVLPDLFLFDKTREEYLACITKVKEAIGRGDSYEMNLTGQFRAVLEAPLPLPDARSLYARLRSRNPASQAAFVSFPATRTYVLSTSPELFLRLTGENGQQAVMKPIKGTLKRTPCTCSPDCELPQQCETERRRVDEGRLNEFVSDPKERAENLMIVDLIKADLHKFCRTSTVRVHKLMDVEESETVYSLVTTVEGELVPGVGPIEAIRQSFPPGSMTGAPKLRTVQLLEDLEGHRPRGIYSGCLGYISVDNKASLNVVIRTLVVRGCEASVGAGGAITWLSDAEKEWEEVLLKARSVLQNRV